MFSKVSLFMDKFSFCQYLNLYNLILNYPSIVIYAFFNFSGNDTLFLYYFPKSHINFFKFLSFSSLYRFKTCYDMTVIDNLHFNFRFTLFYGILSLSFNKRIMIFFRESANITLFSLTSIFNSINWLEREVYDMFGILFNGHPNLRKILTDYGFSGYPLRRDFPLTGFKEIYYSSYKNKIKYIPVNF